MFKPTGSRSRHVGVVSVVVLVAAGPAWAGGGPAAMGAAAADGTTSRVSVSSNGTQSNGGSLGRPAISSDGSFVAFINFGSNLVGGDGNEVPDVFVRDRTAGTTSRVSVSSDETEGSSSNGEIYSVAISADGRYVAFTTEHRRLVPGDTNEAIDVFVRDRTTGTTRRVSVSSSERQGNGSAYSSVSISADGRYVAYSSQASNLVSGDTNGRADVFVRDRMLATTRRVSVSSNQRQANRPNYDPALSADGTHVAFRSDASNLVSGDTNGGEDVFVRYRPTAATRRVSVSSNETQTPRGTEPSGPVPAISAGGRYVAFHSVASNLVSGDTNGEFGGDVFVRDRVAGTTQRVSVSNNEAQGNSSSGSPSISADGQRVAFASSASNLVEGDTGGPGLFIRDRGAGTTSRVPVGGGPAISGDGRHVAFIGSDESNLVPGDTNGFADTFVWDSAP